MAEERVQRRLAAILAADVVGYSRLMEADEAGTRARLRSLQSDLIEPKIAADGGRIVKTSGDGILVEFGSAVDAVRNALLVQRAMQQHNADIPEDRKIEFRIGINLGDVIVEEDDIHGDGVNVAARLEGLCGTGEVYISGTVHDHVVGKLAATFDDLGERTVKNITKPVRVYRTWIQSEKTADSATSTGPSLVLDKPSIAVLPFENMSGDLEQEYFSDGMAEDLITDISKISGLFVVARNSSFAFKGQSVDVKVIAGQLGVKHILEGSVRKMGDRLRVNAQLIDAASGGHVWAERYDGDMERIFEFQDDIREQIVFALQVSLTPTDKAITERKPTDSVEAYDLFLKGRSRYYLYAKEHLHAAAELFKRAIEIDPNFAEAYGYLSYCMFAGSVFGYSEYGLDPALEMAEKAVSLDANSAIALTRLAWIQGFVRQFDKAIPNFEKSLSLEPNNAETLSAFGEILNFHGDPEKGVRLVEKAHAIDTFVPPSWQHHLGHSYYLLGRTDEAVAKFREAVERVPYFRPAHLFLACAYVETGRMEYARAVVKALTEIHPDYTIEFASKVLPICPDMERDRFFDLAREAGLPER